MLTIAVFNEFLRCCLPLDRAQNGVVRPEPIHQADPFLEDGHDLDSSSVALQRC